MELLFEIIFQFFGELILQLLFELLGKFGSALFSSSALPANKPFMVALGAAIWGSIAGVISLLILPHAFLTSMPLRLANLVITPVIVGAVMASLGSYMARKGKRPVSLDRFGYAFVFALAMAGIRFIWAR